MDVSSTKEKIMDVAIKLFSDRGYDVVSMRDIAAEVGIKAASIYNHFPSKRDILKTIYQYYTEQFSLISPKKEELIRLLETGPLRDALHALSFYLPPELQDRMDRIFLIASQRICLEKESEIFIREHFFKPLIENGVMVLNRGIELGKIRPIDTGSFIKLATYIAFSAAELNRTSMKITYEQWIRALDMLFSLLEPVKE
jgi:AcrR family transcriptional regulator